VPHAKALGVLLRSIIVEREPIYRQQETVHGFAQGLFGLSAEQMDHLSDDRIGRALDHLFDADRAVLLTEVVLAVGQRFGVKFDRLHNDHHCFLRPISRRLGSRAPGPKRGDHLWLLQRSPPRLEAAAVHPDRGCRRRSRGVSLRRRQRQ